MRDSTKRLAMGALIATVLAVVRMAVPFHAAGPAGPPGVRILRFVATTGALSRGESAQLCYRVENARKVWIVPRVEAISSAGERCVDIHPEHTTHYTLEAEGFDGTVAVRSLTIAVRQTPVTPVRGSNIAAYRSTTTRTQSASNSRNVRNSERSRKNWLDPYCRA